MFGGPYSSSVESNCPATVIFARMGGRRSLILVRMVVAGKLDPAGIQIDAAANYVLREIGVTRTELSYIQILKFLTIPFQK